MLENIVVTIGATLIVIGILVFVHELGHFLAARWAGVRVLRFSIGLGKPIFMRKIGDTEYAISWIPLGGYVRMAGMNMGKLEDAEDNVDSEVPADELFDNKPAYQRAVILLAGVAMNVLFAIATIAFVVWIWGRPEPLPMFVNPPTADFPELEVLHTIAGEQVVAIDGRMVRDNADLQAVLQTRKAGTVRIQTASGREVAFMFDGTSRVREYMSADLFMPDLPPVIGRLSSGGSARQAGLQVGDRIVSINDQPVHKWSDIPRIVQTIEDTARVIVARNEETLAFAVPVLRVDDDTRAIGIASQSKRTSVDPGEALVAGFEESAYIARLMFVVLGDLITGRAGSDALGGPIYMADVAGEVARHGMDSFLYLMAGISINLAIVNLIPIPILDGGLLMLLLIETLLRRPLSARAREKYLAVGYAMVMGIMVWVILIDLLRVIS